MKHNMEAKHTPGSWNYWHKSETDENIVSIHEEHSNLERVIAIVSEEADCPLIASAPELIGVLKNLVDRNLIKDVDGDHYEEVLEVLAKAEGRS